MFVVKERKSNSKEFELCDSNGISFGFQAVDSDEARTWVRVIAKLSASEAIAEERTTFNEGGGVDASNPKAQNQEFYSSSEAAKALLVEKLVTQKSSRVAARNELEAIDASAKRRAAAAIADSFHDANDLRGLEAYEEEVKGKLASVVREGEGALTL